MSDTPAIVAFIDARYDEIEAAAQDLGGVEWTPEGDGVFAEGIAGPTGTRRVIAEGLRDAFAEWAARLDPAYVLDDIAAKRRILARHSGDHLCPNRADPDWIVYIAGERVRMTYPCGDLRDLAMPFRGHPDFDPAWTVK